MRYHEAPAPAPLDPWVRCFWFLTTAGVDPQPVVPDGRLEIVLHRAAPFGEVLANGAIRCQDAVMVSGQLTRPIELTSCGPADIIGIRFRTAGGRDLLGLPLGDLINRVIPLSELDPALVTALERAAHTGEPVSAITAVLLSRLQAYRHPASAEAVSRLARGETVAHVSRALGVSIRTLERHVRDDTGLPPKMLQRVMRFRTLYTMLLEGQGTWARAAARAGYYDQTHANRDFHQFTGGSPREHFERDHALAQAFLSHFS